jgi:hypothetical protein
MPQRYETEASVNANMMDLRHSVIEKADSEYLVILWR